MTGMKRSSEGLDPRRRKLLFMCWHRGIREMDLIMGRFADENIDRLNDAEIAQPLFSHMKTTGSFHTPASIAAS